MLFMGVISPGMKRDEILRLLRGKLAQPKIVDNSLLWMGKGAVSYEHSEPLQGCGLESDTQF